MMQKHSLYFILRSNKYQVPSVFKHLTDMSHEILDTLIFNFDHSYQVQSKVSEEVFRSFIEYLVEDKMPEINIDNINEFIELSQEFNILQEKIEEKKNEYGEYLININFLRFEKADDFSEYEEKVAKHLDEYLEHYSTTLMQIPIQRLYNIFYHQQRKLQQHNEAYESIKTHFENTGDNNIFILLESLDGHQLTKNNLNESISLRGERYNHIPNINFTYISNIVNQQKESETRISNLENQLKHYQEETKTKQNHQKEEIQKLTNIIVEKDKIFNELNQKIESLNIKLDEKTALIENQHLRYQEETKAKHTHQNEEIQSLKKIINDRDIRYGDQLNSLEAKYTLEIKSLMKKIEENDEKYESKLKFQEDKYTSEIKNLNLKIEHSANRYNENETKNNNQLIKIEEKINKNQELYEQNLNEMKSKTLSLVGHSACHSFTTKLSLTNSGILEELKKKEKTKFDNLFIASQSSDDIYNLINPNNPGNFGTPNKNNFYIEFELKETILINGFKIFTSYENFPKSFDIEVNGEVISSIKEANELNGANKDMPINFESVQAQKVRFIQTDRNWDEQNYFLKIRRIELLSNEPKYSKGVFSTLIEENKDHDPHKIGVIISATYFDFNSFYLCDTSCHISTGCNENSWFQIELTQGSAIIHGFRLKRKISNKLKNYKIICTDDFNKPIELWTNVFEIDETNTNEHQILDIYEFEKPSPPSKFIRLVQTGNNWNNSFCLSFFHFDIFGTYF